VKPSLTGYTLHEHRRRDDRDLAKRIQGQQIAIAADDQIGVTVDREL
jgi:hypothetical protein